MKVDLQEMQDKGAKYKNLLNLSQAQKLHLLNILKYNKKEKFIEKMLEICVACQVPMPIEFTKVDDDDNFNMIALAFIASLQS